VQKICKAKMRLSTRVARLFVFKTKIPIWVNLGVSCNGRYCYNLWTLGPFYDLLFYFTDIHTYGVVRGILVYSSRLGILYQEKSGNPAFNLVRSKVVPDFQQEVHQ
jgi:hypothetical protein